MLFLQLLYIILNDFFYTCNCHKQKPQNVCRDTKSRTPSGIQSNVFDDHQVQGLF